MCRPRPLRHKKLLVRLGRYPRPGAVGRLRRRAVPEEGPKGPDGLA